MTQHVLVCKKCPKDIQKKWATSLGAHSQHGKSAPAVAINSSDSEFEFDEPHRVDAADAVQRSRSALSTDFPFVAAAAAAPSKPSCSWSQPKHHDDCERTERKPVKITQMSSFVDHISPQEQAKCDKEIARAIYASGCPLSLTENSHWAKALHTLRPSYVPPSRYQLSNKLLNEEYSAVMSKVNDAVAKAPCLSLQSDGWTNIRGEGIINFMICTPKPVFYKSVSTDTNRHTSEYIADQMLSVIDELGADKFLAVVSDNAANMKGSWKIIQQKYTHIFCYGCVAHGLNLLIGDICKLQSLGAIIDQAKDVAVYVRRHQVVSALLTQYQLSQKGVTTRLQLPVVTRWGSNVACLRSLFDSKAALQSTFIDEHVVNDIPRQLRTRVLDNDVFWPRIEKTLKFLRPFAEAITTVESDEPRLSRVPAIFASLRQHMSLTLSSSPLTKKDEESAANIFDNRETFCKTPLQMAARLLDPTQHDAQFEENDLQQAYACIIAVAQRIGNPSNVDVTDATLAELAGYRAHEGDLWGSQLVWQASKCTESLVWWKGICSNSPLSKVASQILSLPASAASCERNWSAFGNIHTAKRNRLTNIRASKLVYVYHNLQLLEVKSSDFQRSQKRRISNETDDDSDDDDHPDNDDGHAVSTNSQTTLTAQSHVNVSDDESGDDLEAPILRRYIEQDNDTANESDNSNHSRWSGL